MNIETTAPRPPYHDMLRFLDHQLTAIEVTSLAERLRSDEAARHQAAALLLQLGTFGELARDPGQDRVPVRRQPPPRSSAPRWVAAVAGACALAAALFLVIGRPRVPARPSGGSQQPFARPSAARALAPQLRAASGQVLLVRGGSDDMPAPPDQVMVDHLQKLGFEVVQVTDASVLSEDLEGRTLVVISASTRGRVLRERMPELRLRDAPVPIVTCESSTFDLLGMTGPRAEPGASARNGFGSTPDHMTVEVVSPTHPLADGLQGLLQVARAPVALSWGAPAEGAIRVANLGTGRASGLSVQFAYEKGVPMVGLVAPARRVACFVSADAGELLTPEGWRLFDAGVRWAAAQ
jgi:hypothetical protein